MLTANRSLLLLSSFAAVIGVSGCPDPQQRLDDYAGRVIDAAPANNIDAMPLSMVPDVNGTFLFSIAPTFANSSILQFVGTVVFDMNAGTISISIQPLNTAAAATCPHDRSYANCSPFSCPTVLPTTSVTNAGEFMMTDSAMVHIPACANTVTSMAATVMNLSVKGAIKTTDLFCGTITGVVVEDGADLGGPPPSTFGAIRIPSSDAGSGLPAPVFACP